MTPSPGRECASASKPLTFEAYPNRETKLGELRVTRALPIRERRLVGPWCFLDRYGPLVFSTGKPMDVPPHPHIGLQTVSWLLGGEVLHTDSLGEQALARPGSVNVMTAGDGIAHAEETPARNSARLSGVQLWTALPEAHRRVAPSFAHVDETPTAELRGGKVRVFAGALEGSGYAVSPALYFSPIVGLDAQVWSGEALELSLNPDYEHAVLPLGGDLAIEGQLLDERTLYYLGTRREGVELSSRAGGHALIIGGPPFPEMILMWWNFVARAPEEIAEARADWEAAREGREGRFRRVPGEHGEMLAAPGLIRFRAPNPVS